MRDMLVNQIRLFARALDETELRKIYDSEKARSLQQERFSSPRAKPTRPPRDTIPNSRTNFP